MALFDTNSGLGNLFSGMNIFGAKLPDYLSGVPAQGETPAIAGLLNQAQQDKLRNQSLLSGVLGAGATYLAQPKNQNIGLGAILGKSYLGGMQGAQNVYNTAAESEMNKLKIAKELRDAELDRLKVVPNDVREYEYAIAQKQNPFVGSYTEWAKQQANLKAPKTTIQMPNPNKVLLDVDKGTLEGLVGSTNSARSIANNTRTISSLIGNQQGSGAIKLTANLQNFLGINTPTANVNQVIDAIATKGATEIRTPGSGSTSDLEFGAYKAAFPSLATSKEGRDVMVQIAEANAIRNAKLSDWARKNIQSGTFSYEGLANYDNSLGQAVSDNVKKRFDELTANTQNRGGANNPNQAIFNQADQILNRK
jgi:hypothetical protein